MSHGIARLELDGKAQISHWTDMTSAMTREARGRHGPGEWSWGEVSVWDWVPIIL